MDKFRALRAMYNDAGVTINALKLGIGLNTTEEEAAYTFNVAKALGATHVTMELPTDPAVTKRAGELAEKNRFYIGYHNHTQVKPDSWDVAVSQSKYNGLNLDVGHYMAATGQSAIPLIEKYHDRIQSLHLKDRKSTANGGQNMPWGQGDTPLKEIFQFMRKQKYQFPANIELEYGVPEGSTVMAELAKCVKYAKDALA
jgi:sugar phosphate isomerase/epimerase